jgi:hypothetical protein
VQHRGVAIVYTSSSDSKVQESGYIITAFAAIFGLIGIVFSLKGGMENAFLAMLGIILSVIGIGLSVAAW